MAKDIIDHKDIDERSHPAARLFPMLPGPELSELAEDIKKNGQLEPISLHGDLILDGRNRAAACKMLGITPMSVQVETSSPVQYVIAKNLHRRHLTTGQQAAIAAEMLPLLNEECRNRQVAALKNQPHTSSVSNDTNEDGGRAREIAARLAGVSPASVARANTVKKHDQALFEKVKAGEVRLNTAHRSVKELGTCKGPTPGEKKQPTARRANAYKERMESSLSTIEGLCCGLNKKFDTARTASTCTPAEITQWRKIAVESASQLTKFTWRLDAAEKNRSGKPVMSISARSRARRRAVLFSGPSTKFTKQSNVGIAKLLPLWRSSRRTENF